MGTVSSFTCLCNHTQKISCLFLSLPAYLLNTTQTLLQIKSQEFIGHLKRHFMTTNPLTYVISDIQEFVKCCIKSWVHLDLRPNNMLFGRLQPAVGDWIHPTWWTYCTISHSSQCSTAGHSMYFSVVGWCI